MKKNLFTNLKNKIKRKPKNEKPYFEEDALSEEEIFPESEIHSEEADDIDLSEFTSEKKEKRKGKSILSLISDEEDSGEEGPHEYGLRTILVICAAALLVTVIFFAVKFTADHFRYRGYEIISEREGGETGLSTYLMLQDHILRYSSDGAALLDGEMNTIWNKAFAMNSPHAEVNSGYAVFYDRNGTDIVVADEKGQVSAFRTDLPIVAAHIDSDGSVAAITDDGVSSFLKYYSKSGELIADIAENANNKGYPVDVAIADKGNILAVSYIKANEDGLATDFVVYRFSSKEQESGNHEIYAEEFAGCVYPDVISYGKQIALLTESGFISYKIGTEITRDAEVTFDREIISVFYEGDILGFVFNNRGGESSYEMSVYRMNGKELSTAGIDIIYEKVSINEGSILFYNDSEMAVYTPKGVMQFGSVIEEGDLNQVIRLSRNRYLISGNRKSKILQLKLLDRR